MIDPWYIRFITVHDLFFTEGTAMTIGRCNTSARTIGMSVAISKYCGPIVIEECSLYTAM